MRPHKDGSSSRGAMRPVRRAVAAGASIVILISSSAHGQSGPTFDEDYTDLPKPPAAITACTGGSPATTVDTSRKVAGTNYGTIKAAICNTAPDGTITISPVPGESFEEPIKITKSGLTLKSGVPGQKIVLRQKPGKPCLRAPENATSTGADKFTVTVHDFIFDAGLIGASCIEAHYGTLKLVDSRIEVRKPLRRAENNIDSTANASPLLSPAISVKRTGKLIFKSTADADIRDHGVFGPSLGQCEGQETNCGDFYFGVGVDATASRGVELKRITVEGLSYGLKSETSDVTLTSARFKNNDYGVNIIIPSLIAAHNPKLTVKGGVFENNVEGIYFANSSGSTAPSRWTVTLDQDDKFCEGRVGDAKIKCIASEQRLKFTNNRHGVVLNLVNFRKPLQISNTDFHEQTSSAIALALPSGARADFDNLSFESNRQAIEFFGVRSGELTIKNSVLKQSRNGQKSVPTDFTKGTGKIVAGFSNVERTDNGGSPVFRVKPMTRVNGNSITVANGNASNGEIDHGIFRYSPKSWICVGEPRNKKFRAQLAEDHLARSQITVGRKAPGADLVDLKNGVSRREAQKLVNALCKG